jgi:hypothetical protein
MNPDGGGDHHAFVIKIAGNAFAGMTLDVQRRSVSSSSPKRAMSATMIGRLMR